MNSVFCVLHFLIEWHSMYACLCVCGCLCLHPLQMKATEAITAIPEWFQPSSWTGGKRPSLNLPKNEKKEWDKLVRRAEEIGEVP